MISECLEGHLVFYALYFSDGIGEPRGGFKAANLPNPRYTPLINDKKNDSDIVI